MEVCDDCGSEFKTENGLNIHKGHKHGKNTNNCVMCGDRYEVTPAREDLEFTCKSDECHSKYKSKSSMGKGNSNWSGGHNVECYNCGDEIWRTPFQLKEFDKYFCSKGCIGSAGGDYTHRYGDNWQKIREEAIERDNGKCIDCGISREKHKEKYGFDIHVDHIIPRRVYFNDNNLELNDANRIKNLLTMCCVCHKKFDEQKMNYKIEIKEKVAC